MQQSTPQIPNPSPPEPTQLNPLPTPSASAHTQPIPTPPPNNHTNPNLNPSPPSAVTSLDTELHRLARGAGRLRLRIGQALHRLGDGIHELGFSTLGAYALERCNRGGRWAAESRTLARRLEALPLLTKSLETGAIGWSMAELLARHATPQTEAALLQIARRKTVQAMRIALSPQQSQEPQASPHSPAPPDDDELTRTLSLTLPLEEAWALEATRMMVEHMDGKCTAAHFLESLLAEATTPLLDLTTPPQPQKATQPDITTQMEAEHTAWRAQMYRLQHLQAEAELQSRPQVPTNFTTEPDPGEAPNTDDLPTTLEALDARIRHYSAELASRDLFFGRLAQRFLALGGWQTLGFTTEAHYARERLGMSRASLRSKISLARRTDGLRHTTDALQQGHIGFEAAQLIARIATPTTEHAWLDRATRRTFKHLREEVQAVETLTRYAAKPDHSPPTKAQLAQVQALERAILSGNLLRRLTNQNEPNQHTNPDATNAPANQRASDRSTTVQISGTPNDQPPTVQISVSPNDEAAHGQPPAVQISVGANDRAPEARSGTSNHEPPDVQPGTPNDQPPTVQISGTPAAKVTLRIRVPGDLLLHYRQLERLHRKKLPNESFIQFLCATFWQTWVPHLGTSDRWETIYRRDRYRCTSPVCHQRNVTLHHVKYRASGGTDEADNLTSPCAFCHLEGEHGGRLKILPPGSDPTWLLGRHPIIRVHHREKTLLA